MDILFRGIDVLASWPQNHGVLGPRNLEPVLSCQPGQPAEPTYSQQGQRGNGNDWRAPDQHITDKTQRQRASFCEQILIDYEAQLACESETESETSFVCSFNKLWESRMSPYMMNQGVCTQSAPNCGQEVDDHGNPL